MTTEEIAYRADRLAGVLAATFEQHVQICTAQGLKTDASIQALHERLNQQDRARVDQFQQALEQLQQQSAQSKQILWTVIVGMTTSISGSGVAVLLHFWK